MKIDNGYFSDDIFAGGLGDAQANTANSTSADVKGHTNLIVNGGEAKLTSLWNPVTRAWEAATTHSNHNHRQTPRSYVLSCHYMLPPTSLYP